QDLETLLRQKPLAARERDRPVDVGLCVPLAALAALVERAQLLDLAGVRPGPVEIDRHVDVELAAQRGDPSLVELDDLEVPEAPAVVCEDLVHAVQPPCATSPKRSRSRTSRLRRRTSAASKMSLPRTSAPNSADAKGKTTIPIKLSSRCCTFVARKSPV